MVLRNPWPGAAGAACSLLSPSSLLPWCQEPKAITSACLPAPVASKQLPRSKQSLSFSLGNPHLTRFGTTSHQIWDLGRCTALLWVQPWQVAQKPGHHLSPHVPRPHGRWAQSWAALSWLRAQQRSAGSELPPFVLEADMEKTPKAQSPSQFHHKYPDRVSGAELIVKALAAALPETALPAVGGRRLGQEAPRCTRGLCRPALTPSCRHVEGGLLGFGRCCSVHQPVTRLGQ